MPDGPLKSNDQFLVNRNNVSYKMQKSEMTAVYPGDFGITNETDTKFVTPETLRTVC